MWQQCSWASDIWPLGSELSAPCSLLETQWHLSDSNMSCSLFPVWPGWSLSQKCSIQSACIPLHAYQVYGSFWKEIARWTNEKEKVTYFLLSSCNSMRLNFSKKLNRFKKIFLTGNIPFNRNAKFIANVCSNLPDLRNILKHHFYLLIT